MPLGNIQTEVTSLPNGQFVERLGRRSPIDVSLGGSFYSKFYSTVEGSRHLFLKGGLVYGFGVIADIDLTVLFEGLDDTHYLWIEVTGDGNEQDGFVIGGFTPTAAVVGSGSAVPADETLSAGDVTGKKAYYFLGTAVGTQDPLTLNFTPANVGDLQIGYCPSAFTRTRA